MIQGALNWENKDALYCQENNAWETAEPGLDQCNTTMDANGRAAVVKDFEEYLSKPNIYGGTFHAQPEDDIGNFYRDPRNWPLLLKIRDLPLGIGKGQYRPERIPQYHPAAMKAVFNLSCLFFPGGATFEKIASLVWEGNAVGLCLKEPGHYICAVAYDAGMYQIAFKDPWSGNPWPGTRQDPCIPDQNNNKWMTKDDFKNIEGFYLLYEKIKVV